MCEITGLEPLQDIPPKVLAVYQAVQQLVGEGRDVNELSVADITKKAGIGKGTIYDYFDSKEEIIACAFLFYIKQVAEMLTERMGQMDSLREQMAFLFDEFDKESDRKVCFVHFIHGATDHSKHSQIIHDKLQKSEFGKNFPEYLLGDLVRKGMERGEINPALPAAYLVYVIFCKIFTYMMCLGTEDCFDVDIRQMRQLIIDGTMREIGMPDSAAGLLR